MVYAAFPSTTTATAGTASRAPRHRPRLTRLGRRLTRLASSGGGKAHLGVISAESGLPFEALPARGTRRVLVTRVGASSDGARAPPASEWHCARAAARAPDRPGEIRRFGWSRIGRGRSGPRAPVLRVLPAPEPRRFARTRPVDHRPARQKMPSTPSRPSGCLST
jgi:hypothetical protein